MKPSPLARIRALALSLPAACALFLGPLTQAQPTINSMYPDGTLLFQYTNSLQVAALTSSSITAFSISLIATNQDGVVTSNHLTSGNGLTLTSPEPGEEIGSTALASNIAYQAIISLTDSGGTLTVTDAFDTYIPAYLWEAEDYDYGGGKSLEHQTNGYSGLYGKYAVDAFNPNGGGSAYRPVDDMIADTNTDLGTESTLDIPRAGYNSALDPNASFIDYDQGWNNGGSRLWGNYTHPFPAGKWNIIGRMAGDGSSPKSAIMYQGGTNGTILGQFNVVNTANWQVYNYNPLSDSAGNPIEWDTDGTSKTLTIQSIGGSYNGNFYFLVPINPNFAPKPTFSHIVPDSSTNVFTPTNLFSFTVDSVPGIQTSNVVVTINGVTPYGLTYSGTAHTLTGTFPMQSNVVYNISLTATDADGSSSYSEVVGTFGTNNYTWEAEDWDYNSGQFIDNPQVDAYVGLAGVQGVDANNTQGGGTAYRSNDTGDLGNEVTGDAKRAQYIKLGTNDYDAGWTSGGNWANYTRHYPAGVYNIYMRSASPNGQNDTVTLSWVTSGVGTPTQTYSKIGQFNSTITGGWQNWNWAPLVDSSGNPVVVTNTGNGVSTIHMAEDNGGFNANFFMLAPVDTQRPSITGIYPNGATQFQHTNSLSFTVNSPVALNSSNVKLTVNGVVRTDFTTGGTATAMTVSLPLQLNQAYNVSILVQTPANDSASVSFRFDTFSSSYYTWEAEDFDYNGGSFFDNPQVDKYTGLPGEAGIDCVNNTTGEGGSYRVATSDGGDWSTEVTGDAPRAQFAGTNDYDCGWTAAGQWANYTRHYPAGTYNVYFRVAHPGAVPNSDTLWQVTGGLGTADQTTNLIGHVNCPDTGGYQNWTTVPVLDSGGNLATVTTTGNAMTFKVVQAGGSANLNYFMLVPVGTAATGPVLTIAHGQDAQHLIISWTPAGNTLYSSPTLGAGSTWTAVGTANPATVTISGTAQYYYVGK